MAKTVTIQARIDPDIKNKAQNIFRKLNISMKRIRKTFNPKTAIEKFFQNSSTRIPVFGFNVPRSLLSGIFLLLFIPVAYSGGGRNRSTPSTHRPAPAARQMISRTMPGSAAPPPAWVS